MNLDILAFGIHPDDVELSCSGTLAKHKSLGYKVGICDLTCGEMGTRGNGELRLIEAENSRKILNLDIRENLYMKDVWELDNQENCLKIIQIIRKYQPKIILCNSDDNRHPDHKKGSEMLKKAAFLSGLSKIETFLNNEKQDFYRPQSVFHYIQATMTQPDFVVDISGFMDKKIESIMAYSSQFYNPNSNEPETFISDKSFMELVKAKDIIFGKSIGVEYAEGFLIDRYLGINDLMHLI